jgi:hypothetical protein
MVGLVGQAHPSPAPSPFSTLQIREKWQSTLPLFSHPYLSLLGF